MINLSGVGRRAFGIIVSPRTTFDEAIRSPQWFGILALPFLVAAGSSAIVLETNVGQLALLDQWERTASAFGRTLNDTEYAVLADASRNGGAYAVVSTLVSGPLLAFALSALTFACFRTTASGVTFSQILSVVTHAGVILALRQVIAAAMTYATESLGNPITMGVFFRMLDEASPIARFFGIIDLFVVWWAMMLAIGMSALYRRPTRRVAGVFVGAYVTLAVVLTAVMAATGGTT